MTTIIDIALIVALALALLQGLAHSPPPDASMEDRDRSTLIELGPLALLFSAAHVMKLRQFARKSREGWGR